MRVRFGVRCETQPWISVIEAFPAFYLTVFNISICAVLRNCNNNSTSIPFYSCCSWISIDRGAANTSGEVNIKKLRLTSFIEMLLYCILY